MACGNARLEAYTAGGEASLSSPEIVKVGAFSVQTLGAAPEAPPAVRRHGPAGVQDRRQSRRMARQGTWEALSCPRARVAMGCPTTTRPRPRWLTCASGERCGGHELTGNTRYRLANQ